MKCKFCDQILKLSKIDAHELQCGQIKCDNPLCRKQLEDQMFYEIVTSEGKLCVCNDICENLAKLDRIKKNKSYIDCLKFFQSILSSGLSIGMKPSISQTELVHKKSADSFGESFNLEKNECLTIEYI